MLSSITRRPHISSRKCGGVVGLDELDNFQRPLQFKEIYLQHEICTKI